jgi:hypothetical protein
VELDTPPMPIRFMNNFNSLESAFHAKSERICHDDGMLTSVPLQDISHRRSSITAYGCR